MNLHEIEIDGFGVWNGLKLDQLSAGINVIYGPNEAGKSTLLQFVRSMLYGFTPARCRRYLPPVNGGEPGGTLEFSAAGDRYRFVRRPQWNDTRLDARDDLQLRNSAGRPVDGDQLPRLLDHLDEPVFQNVFAVGLAEMQELGTLTDTEASRLLYDLTTGLERVSLGEVIRDLASSRRRLLAADGQTGELNRLIAQRQQLLAEGQQAASQTRDFARWNREREQLDAEIRQLDDERSQLDRQVRMLETAAGLRGRWQERLALDLQLAELSAGPTVPERAIDIYESLGRRVAKRRQRLAQAKSKLKALRTEGRGLRVNDLVLDHAPRVAALTDQHDTISLQDKLSRDLDAEIADLEMQLLAEPARPAPEIVPVVSASPEHPALEPNLLARLRKLADTLERAREKAEEAKQEAVRLQDEPEPEPEPLQVRAVEPEPPEEEETLESAGNLVANLRRRLQIEQRMEGLNRQEVELEARCNELIDNQLLPVGVLAGLGSLFIVGVILVLASLFLPTSVTGSSGLALAVVGIGGTALAAMAKHKLEHVAESQLETTEKQIGTLRTQISQARQEREALDAVLPRGGGPLTMRLQTAERRLAELEAELSHGDPRRTVRTAHERADDLDLNELQPAREIRDSRRRTSPEQREAIRNRAKETHRRLTELRREWSTGLVEAGLRSDISGQQFLDTAHLYVPRPAVRRTEDDSRIREWEIRRRDLQRRLDQRKLDREQAQHGLRSHHQRIQELVTDVGFSLPNVLPGEQLQRLRQHVREQELLVTRRKRTASRIRRQKLRREKIRSELRALLKRRRRMLRRAGAADEEEFRGIAAQAGAMQRIRQRREVVERELSAARAGQLSEDELRGLLADDAGQTVESHWEESSSRLQAVEGRLRTLQARRNELGHSLAGMAADRRPAACQLELNAVEERLRAAKEKWQVLAAAQQVLQSVRGDYERDRQPETLREATGYLERLTLGRYTRIWTPLDEDALYVDNADGERLGVEALSRGTREQVFLSLRLALARAYARRGATLPLVLDDVMVNFDDERAKATAGLLVEYAELGQQTFVFTCHEHIMRLFKARKAPIIRLPSRDGLVAARKRRQQAEVEVAPLEFEPTVELAVPPAEPAAMEQPVPVVQFVELAPLPAEPAAVALPPPPAPLPRTPAPVIVLPFAEVYHPEPVIPAPHFFPKPAPEPKLERNPREAPADADADLVIDDLWFKRQEPRFVHDAREAPADADADLVIDDAYRLRASEPESVYMPHPPRLAEAVAPTQRVIRRRWRGVPFTGEGAEEFAGEFAVRPTPGTWEEWEEAADGQTFWIQNGEYSEHDTSADMPTLDDFGSRARVVLYDEDDAIKATDEEPRDIEADWKSQTAHKRWERTS
ncbi:MAG: AAA family ATPase [Pirellulales bacterium]